jgi:hypothetical protein
LPIALLAACQNHPKRKQEAKGRLQMSVIQRTDSVKFSLFILDTETGEVTMRGDKSERGPTRGALMMIHNSNTK